MKTPEQLIQTLRTSPFWQERRETAFALGRQKGTETRNALIEALNDPDEDVLHAAIIALGNVGDEEIVERMLLPRFLRHPNENIRWATLQSIGKIGQFCRIPDIAELTNDDAWIVRNEALKLIRKQTESMLEHCSPESARRMIALLIDSNPDLYKIILDALMRIGPKIKPFLRDVLKTGGKNAKMAMSSVLGRLEDKESIPILIDLLHSSDKDIRKHSVDALGQIKDRSSIPALLEMFGDPSQEIKKAAVSAIAKIGKDAVPALHERIQFSSRKTIKQNALFALARIRDASSIPYFVTHLGSTYFIVRRAAINGLVQYGNDAIEEILQVIRNIKLSMVDDLLKQAETGVTVGIRVRAIKALGALADHRAIHLLKRLAASIEPEIQKASLESLAQIGCSCWQRCGAMAVLRELRIAPDIDLIIEQLDDDSENVRLRAIQVLERGGNPSAVPALLRTVETDANDNLRGEALRAADELAPADAKTVNAACKVLEDEAVSSHLRAEAARIIGRSPDKSHIPALIACLQNLSWEVRRNAALALGNLGELALPALLDRLDKAEEIELESVIRTIGNVGSPTAQKEIEDIMQKYPVDSPVHYAAIKATANIRERAV